MIGSTLSHYTIVSELGRGGMGAVYRAVDDRLGRDAALKVLHASVLSNPKDRARFYREGRAAASLTHPHIAVVYEIDEAVPGDSPGEEPRPFIAMEFIEGESLDERIDRGPLPLEDAVAIAVGIASGLDAAHERDIVHRDIKASNVMLAQRGEAKIVDFGLAQTTASTRLTVEGTMLGTVTYMSPEQTRADPVDRRTDLWSLGVVLYEMIAGIPPFPGENQSTVLHKIQIEDPVPLTAIRTGVPMELEAIVLKLLRKDPALRYQHADDLIADLRALRIENLPTRSSGSGTAPARTPAEVRRPTAGTWAWYGAGLVLACLLGALAASLLGSDEPVHAGEATVVELYAASVDEVISPRISPDGRTVVFVGVEGSGRRLYRRDLSDGSVERPIDGTVGASYPFFSPDGEQVGFIADGIMYGVRFDGGRPTRIADAEFQSHWADDGYIYYNDRDRNLLRITPAGEGRDSLIATDRSVGEEGRVYPFRVAGTPWLLFEVYDSAWISGQIAALNLETGETKPILDGGSEPRLLPTGHLVFTRLTESDGYQMAVPIDPETLALLGDPDRLPILANRFFSSPAGGGSFVAPTGQSQWAELTLFDPEDGEVQVRPPMRTIYWPRISPTGDRISLLGAPYGNQIWMYRIDISGPVVRVISEGPLVDEESLVTYAWSPDGAEIAYGYPGGGFRIKNVDDPASDRQVFEADGTAFPTSWSADGTISFYLINADGNRDLWLYSVADSTAVPFFRSEFNERGGMISPNGRFLAYASDESGRDEIWVQPLPATGQKYRVTNDGGDDPGWSIDGRQLLYARGKDLMAVPVDISGAFHRLGDETVLHDSLYRLGDNLRNYDMHPDGRRLLVIRSRGGVVSKTIQVTLNGYALLERVAPVPR